MMRWVAIILGMGAVTLTSCAAIDDYHYCLVNHYRSESAFKKYYAAQERKSLSSHFASGWRHGYFDVSTGGTGEPPVVPPSKYWSPKYQTASGHQAIEDWYMGFQDGAMAAESAGNPSWHPIHTAPTVPMDPLGWPTMEIFPSEMFGSFHSPSSATLPIATPEVLETTGPIPPKPESQPPMPSIVTQETPTKPVAATPPVEASGRTSSPAEEEHPVPPVYTDE